MITQKAENKEKETHKSSHEILDKGIDHGELFSDLRNQNKENIQLQQKANKSKTTKKITQLQNLANPTNTEKPSAEANKEQTNALPKSLQKGIESLSGESMNDVKVHYNSNAPAQLNAHAFAQGNNIHVASGQEKHLPHEAWHVVQQKQGRVKPTKQLKKINTPKEAHTEENDIQEAVETNVREVKSLTVMATPAPPPSDNHPKPKNTISKNPIQRAANLAELDNSKPFNQEDVETLEPQDTGADKAIELEGKLTTVAKIKGFFGKNSTWDKFTVLAQKFNNSKEVMEKRGMLPQLKALAEEWMRRHANDEKDDNLEAKTNTIKSFLNSLKSNQQEIIQAYNSLDLKMKGISAAPIEKRSEFQEAIHDYKHIKSLIETFKSSYPPSINLMYKEEIVQIHEADEALTKKISKTAGAFDTGLGLQILNATAEINLEEEAYCFEGAIAFNIGGVKNASAKGKCYINPDGNIKDLQISEGSLTYESGSITLNCNALSYSYSSKQFVLGETSGVIAIGGKTILLQAINAQIKDGEFSYDQLHGTYNETFDTGYGLKVNTPKVAIYKGGIIELIGDLELEHPEYGEAKGNVHVKLDEQLNVTQIKINKGQINGAIYGSQFKMTNIHFNKANQSISAQHTKGQIELMGQTFNLIAEGMTYQAGTYTYKTLKGSYKGILDSSIGISVNNPSLEIDQDANKIISGGLEIKRSEVASLSGQVTLKLSKENNITTIDVEEGSGIANLMGIKISLNGVNYTHQDKSLSAEEATASATIFGKTVTLNAEEVAFNNNHFDYAKITANLPDVEHEFFKLSHGYLSHTKETQTFQGSAEYSFINEKAPPGLEDFKELSGLLALEWGNEQPAHFSIQNGQLKFSILNNSVEAQLKQFDYDSREAVFNAEDISIDVNIPKVNKKLTGKNVSISKSGFHFTEIGVDAGEKHQMGMIELAAESYKLKNDEKGYGLGVEGELGLKIPKYLKPKSDNNKIKIAGDAKLHFNNNRDFEYNITAAKALLQIDNPLQKLNELFGENWTASRYELSAGIPIFPGIFAIFGLFFEYGAKLDDYINLVLNFEDELVHFDTETQFKVNAAAGVFGGVQGGSQLLIALAILLQASGNFDMIASLGYHKTFGLKKRPEEKDLKTDGLHYGLSGELKAIVDLKLVATALYFFSKSLDFKLGEKSFGSFEFSNKKETPPNMSTPLVDDKKIRDEIDDDKKEIAKKLTIAEIIDFDVTKRFNAQEKRETIDAIKEVETERQNMHDTDTPEGEKTNTFNNVPLANLQFYHNFIDNRFDFKQIISEMKTFRHMDSTNTSEEYLSEVNTLITKLGKIINTASVFVDHYGEKTAAFYSAYNYIASSYSAYKKMLDDKYELLDEINTFKSGHLHSSFWGDEKKLKRQLKTSSWFGDSNYEKLCVQYNNLSAKLIAKEHLFDDTQEASKSIGHDLIKAHRAFYKIEDED